MKISVFFLLLCTIPYFINAKESVSLQQSFDTSVKEIEQICFTKGSVAQKQITKLYQIANSYPDSLILKTKCLYLETTLCYMQGIYDSTLIYRVQEELKYANSVRNPYQYALLRYSLALNLLTKSSYADAFSIALRTSEQFLNLNDSLFTAKTLLILGRVCNSIESYSLAEEYYSQAKAFTTPSQQEYYLLSSNIFNLWGRMNQPKEAIDSLLSLIPIIETKRDTGLLASTYLNIGTIYIMKKEYEEAYQYFTSAKSFSPFIDNNQFFVSLYQNLGIYYVMVDNFNSAYNSFQTAKTYAIRSNNPALILPTLSALSHVHEALNHDDSAYFYLKKYSDLKQKITLHANPIEAYQAYVSTYVDGYKKELTIKEQEILFKNRYLIVVIISAISIFLLIFSWLIILQQQKRHSRQQAILKEAENKELEKRLDIEQKIQQLQEERIAAQTREITSHSLMLSNKNDVLQQIANVAKRLPRQQEESREINHIIKSNITTDGSWESFMLHFDKVHPSFFNRIKSFSNALSENDLRLCAYIRIGMPTKQLAQMLNVSPDSIRKHRYRIRKKLELSEEQNLDDFIRNI